MFASQSSYARMRGCNLLIRRGSKAVSARPYEAYPTGGIFPLKKKKTPRGAVGKGTGCWSLEGRKEVQGGTLLRCSKSCDNPCATCEDGWIFPWGERPRLVIRPRGGGN